jgi:hypothetical protein
MTSSSSTCDVQQVAGHAGPRSTISHSRHSTSSRNVTPSAKVGHYASRRIALGKLDGEEVEGALLVLAIDIAALDGVDPVEPQRGAVALEFRIIGSEYDQLKPGRSRVKHHETENKLRPAVQRTRLVGASSSGAAVRPR